MSEDEWSYALQLSMEIPSQASRKEGKRFPNDSANEVSQFMSLRILRGPLKATENREILKHYNRLTSSRIPMEEYLRWVTDGPDGPAWHAILENEASEIVGHTAVIPMRGFRNGRQVVGGKAEYAFILEEYQASKIRGFEKSGRPRNTIMIQQLFQRCQNEFDPLLISTSDVRRRSLSNAGGSTVTFTVSECLLVMRPWNAARLTPNLRGWQRTTLCFAGIFQKLAWAAGRLFSSKSSAVRSSPIDKGLSCAESAKLCFFGDLESMRWRYPEDQYESLIVGDNRNHLIIKNGSPDRYLRICQWRLSAGQPSFQLLAKLVEIARSQGTLGVRWAAYGDDELSRELVRQMKKFGFLCARRTRSLLICSREQELLSSDGWDLTDAMFSFDP